MAAMTGQAPAVSLGMPALSFVVLGAEDLHPAAVPTLKFTLGIDAGSGHIRSVLLDIQIQIAARGRSYVESEQRRLLELFGTPERWATTLRTLPWTRTTVVVPPFDTRTELEVMVPCTYDLEVTAARYMAGLDNGEIPLQFLFSGSVFYLDDSGRLQTARIGWDRDTDYRLPVAVWRAVMARHFANGAWLRLHADTLARLTAFKGEHAFANWDVTLGALLDGAQGR